MGGRAKDFVERQCSVETCCRKFYARDLCSMHYQRMLAYGSIDAAGGQKFRGQHHNWKGDEIGYSAAHKRLVIERGNASDYMCADCGGAADSWAFDEPSGYSTDLTRYRPLCNSCHARADGKGLYTRRCYA